MTPPPSSRIESAAAARAQPGALQIDGHHLDPTGAPPATSRASPVRMSAPALLTQAWTRPNASSVDPSRRLTSSARETSARTARPSPPAARISRTTASPQLARARVVDDHAGAVPREAQRDRAADPAAGAGDHRYLSRQARHEAPSLPERRARRRLTPRPMGARPAAPRGEGWPSVSHSRDPTVRPRAAPVGRPAPRWECPAPGTPPRRPRPRRAGWGR